MPLRVSARLKDHVLLVDRHREGLCGEAAVGDERTWRPGEGEEKKRLGPLHDPENVEHHHTEGDTDHAVEVGHDSKARLIPAASIVERVLVEHEPCEQAIAHGLSQGNDLGDTNFSTKLVSQTHPRDALPHFSGRTGFGSAQTIVVTAHP